MPARLRVTVIGEVVLATAISAVWFAIVDGLGWPQQIDDTVISVAFILAPVGVTILSGWLANRLWRANRHSVAMVCVVLPGLALLGLIVAWAGEFG